MYYDERIINGILMYRTSPTGEWRQCSIETMSERIMKLEAYRSYIESNMGRVINSGDWKMLCYNEFLEEEYK